MFTQNNFHCMSVLFGLFVLCLGHVALDAVPWVACGCALSPWISSSLSVSAPEVTEAAKKKQKSCSLWENWRQRQPPALCVKRSWWCLVFFSPQWQICEDNMCNKSDTVARLNRTTPKLILKRANKGITFNETLKDNQQSLSMMVARSTNSCEGGKNALTSRIKMKTGWGKEKFVTNQSDTETTNLDWQNRTRHSKTQTRAGFASANIPKF